MNPRWDVLGLGAVAVDDLVYVDQYPLPDTKLPIQAQERQGGGLAGTALVTAARLGVNAAYFGVLGGDELSRFTLEELKREGVDCAPTLHNPSARPYHSIVIVDLSTGQRSILYSADGVMEPELRHIGPDLVGNCRVLFVDHTSIGASLRAVELAHTNEIPVVGDFERIGDARLPDLIDQIDHLILGLPMAQETSGEAEPGAAVRALSRPDRACCVVTAGERGCWYSEYGGGVRHCPAFQVQVVDTTGCGDVFHGAYAACIARGEDVDRAIRVATAAAGIKATQPGGRKGIPDLATVNHFLDLHPGRALEEYNHGWC